MTRKANEYYLASPTIQASLWERIGGLTGDSEQLGKLWETYIANSLIRMQRYLGPLGDLFYDYKEGGADFILRLRNGNLVAVEVGWGGKGVGQTLKTLTRVDGEYGIVISGHPECHREVETEKGKYDLYFLHLNQHESLFRQKIKVIFSLFGFNFSVALRVITYHNAILTINSG